MSRTPLALIETIRVIGGRAPLYGLHLRRLVASCQALGIPFPLAFKIPEGGPDRAHRLEVGPAGVAVTERPVGPVDPVRLRTSLLVHPGYRHKTTERTAFDRAQAQARPDEAVLLTAAGEVAEAGLWCLFWWEGDTLCAPALELGILPGVSRMRVEELAGPVAERRVGRAALLGRSVFVTNALRGVVPVMSWDTESVPKHPATAFLASRFWG
ncbi:MAG: aminotransferase class IV [Gemmatimonadota bacterium]|nr:aminotransferase class IV [Gemmatimonadota bacterium]